MDASKPKSMLMVTLTANYFCYELNELKRITFTSDFTDYAMVDETSIRDCQRRISFLFQLYSCLITSSCFGDGFQFEDQRIGGVGTRTRIPRFKNKVWQACT